MSEQIERKPLELKTFRIWESGFGDFYAGIPGREWPERVDFMVYAKRFTDTELAAEVFRAAAWLGALGRAYASDEGRNIVFEAAFTYGPLTREEHEWEVVNRFLNRPHYRDSLGEEE